MIRPELSEYSDEDIQDEFLQRLLRSYRKRAKQKKAAERAKEEPRVLPVFPQKSGEFLKWAAGVLGVEPRELQGGGPGTRGSAIISRKRYVVANAAFHALMLTQTQVAILLGYGDHTAARYAIMQAAKDPALLADAEALISQWKTKQQ